MHEERVGLAPVFLIPFLLLPPRQHFEDGGAFCYWCQDAQELPKVPLTEWGCSQRVLLSDTRILVGGRGGTVGEVGSWSPPSIGQWEPPGWRAPFNTVLPSFPSTLLGAAAQLFRRHSGVRHVCALFMSHCPFPVIILGRVDPEL